MLLQTVRKTAEITDLAAFCLYRGPLVFVFSPDDEAFGSLSLSLGEIPFKWYKGKMNYPFLRFSDLSDMLEEAEAQGSEGSEVIVLIDELLLAEGFDFTRIKRLAVARRHLNIMLIASSQRPVSFPVIYFALLDELQAGRIEDSRDLEHLKGALDSEQIKQLPLLERGEFIRKGSINES